MKEKRIIELRAGSSAEDQDLILEGVPVVFASPTTIKYSAGDYIEIIERGALDETDLTDVRLIYNHDLSKVPLARTPRTMSLERDSAGLRMRATLPQTEAGREIYEAVRRGDLSGMSFAFTVPQGGDTYDPRTNTRRIHRINKIYECSVVPFPAYAETSVEARSEMSKGKEKYLKVRDLKILANKIIFGGKIL